MINNVDVGTILTSGISAFPSNTVSIFPCSTNANAPEGKGGIYHVYKFADASYSYSEYKIWDSNIQYRRRWTGSAWGAWEKVSAV